MTEKSKLVAFWHLRRVCIGLAAWPVLDLLLQVLLLPHCFCPCPGCLHTRQYTSLSAVRCAAGADAMLLLPLLRLPASQNRRLMRVRITLQQAVRIGFLQLGSVSTGSRQHTTRASLASCMLKESCIRTPTHQKGICCRYCPSQQRCAPGLYYTCEILSNWLAGSHERTSLPICCTHGPAGWKATKHKLSSAGVKKQRFWAF